MLVDTSVWIDFFNGYASFEADRLAQALEEDLNRFHYPFNDRLCHCAALFARQPAFAM